MADYITLADGSRVDVETGQLVRIEEKDDGPVTLEVLKKSVSELPDSPDKINVINIVIGYKMFGLNDADIAELLKLTPQQIKEVTLDEVYQKMLEAVMDGLREHDFSDVRKTLKKYEQDAAKTVGDLLTTESPSIRLSAARDILDRGGHRPVDVVEHKHKVEGGLTIEVIKKGGGSSLPVIDVKPEVIQDGNSC